MPSARINSFLENGFTHTHTYISVKKKKMSFGIFYHQSSFALRADIVCSFKRTVCGDWNIAICVNTAILSLLASLPQGK